MAISPLEASPSDKSGRTAAPSPSRSAKKLPRDELAGSALVQLPAPSDTQRRAPPEMNRQPTVLVNVSEHGRISYQMLDSKTGKIIFEIPPKEIRNAEELISKLQRSSPGPSVDFNS